MSNMHDLIIFLSTKLLPLLYSIFGFSLLVVVHELGHLTFCKLFGVYAPTFSIGFGPRLLSYQFGETTYCLSAIPFGGYVEIAGLEEIGQGDQAFAKASGSRAFSSKNVVQKLLILFGGIFFNLIFAYSVFCALFMIGYQPSTPGVEILAVQEASPAQKAGILAGDIITSIGTMSENPLTSSSLLEAIAQRPDEEISLTISRKKEIHHITVVLGSKIVDNQTRGLLGAELVQISGIERVPFMQAIRNGIAKTNEWIVTIAKSFKALFSGNNLGGPLRIIETGFKSAQYGILSLFIFLALMSINLALLNVLPLGITDGGNIFFVLLEAILRRPAPAIIQNSFNIASVAFFIFLGFYLTYKDSMQIFGSKITLYSMAALILYAMYANIEYLTTTIKQLFNR